MWNFLSYFKEKPITKVSAFGQEITRDFKKYLAKIT